VAVVPQLVLLRRIDALAQPPLGPVVLDEHRRARAEHPVGARRLTIEVIGAGPLHGRFEE
jgi:hypothetical protein